MKITLPQQANQSMRVSAQRFAFAGNGIAHSVSWTSITTMHIVAFSHAVADVANVISVRNMLVTLKKLNKSGGKQFKQYKKQQQQQSIWGHCPD